MDVSIVIVNWNGGEMLADCLASIPAATKNLKAQVIVVDNASSDGSREMAQRRFPQFQVVNSGANMGFGRANNLAKDLVTSDLVLFLNPDTVLLENSLEPMVKFIREHPEVGAVGCKMRYPDGEVHEQGLQYVPSPWTEFFTLLFLTTGTRALFKHWLPTLNPNESRYVIKLYGGCLLCRRNLLDQVGWFDERYFMYAEDVDLCRSMIERGAKLFYLSTAEIIHIAGGSSKKAPGGFSVLMKAESLTKFMHKHHGGVGALIYRLEILASASLRAAFAGGAHLAACAVGKGRNAGMKDALSKHWILILWSLGLRKPVVAS